MYQYLIAAILILVILLIIYRNLPNNEGYRSCRCDSASTTYESDSTVINPYIWPNSAYNCPNYPMFNKTTPDHVIKTN